MKETDLGDLIPDPRLSGQFLATIGFQGRQIQLRLDPDDVDFSVCMQLARDIVSSMQDIESKAKSIAVQALLKTYNENWRHASSDGASQSITPPALDADEFARRIDLTSVVIRGSSLVQLRFGYDDLFAGHDILVTSFDGAGFQSARAILAG